ncbi:hypothetical protein BGZ60DRAFT_516433 [Tricladium varicosporioides]|nr:hypothetical protein BGZ60DRAFT_516433 [Hymenoscyphus varicosporioides]
MHSSYILLLASAVSVLAAPQSAASQLQARKQYKSKDGMVININDAPAGSEKRDVKTYTTKSGMTITISDAPAGSEKRDEVEEEFEEPEEDSVIEKRASDYISSCGPKSGWTPIADVQGPSTGIWPFQKEGPWYWGYQSAVHGFCNGVAADFDGNPFTIAPGKILSTTRRWQYELEQNGRRIGLKGFVAGHIEFEIHNKDSKDHVPNQDDCTKYLMKMAETSSSCYGSNNKDTKGGSYQVGADKISYHALPAKD